MSSVNTSTYLIAFLPPGPKAPSNLLAEAVLRFSGGMLADMELRGFSVWDNGPGKDRSVSMPSRSYMAGGVKKNWDLLRATEPFDHLAPPFDPKALPQALGATIVVAYASFATSTLPKAPSKPPMSASTSAAFSDATQGLAAAKAKPSVDDL